MASLSNTAQDHQKIGETILLRVQSLLVQSDKSGAVNVLVTGPFHEAAEQTLAAAFKLKGDGVRYLRAFKGEEERRSWSARYEELYPGVESLALDIEEETFGRRGFRIGQFDLVAIVGTTDGMAPGGAILANLKHLLKRRGLLLLEIRGELSSAWKQALGWVGFEGVRARSDKRNSNQVASERDLLIARSDGCVQIQSVVGPDPPVVDHFPSRSSGASTTSDRLQRGSTDLPDPASAGLSHNAMSRQAVRERVIALLEQMLQLSATNLDTSSPFIEFGVDSIVGVRFVSELNRQLHIELKATVLFDYGSVEKLATFIAEQCRPVAAESTQVRPFVMTPTNLEAANLNQGVVSSPSLESLPIAPSLPLRPQTRETDVAVIGISGRFPGANNVEEFWQNLANGKNSIGEVPRERWDHSLIYESGSRRINKTYSKWGGLLADADKFDPLFFNISGREAEATDPQHRLFLEECYHAMEDSGYTGPSASGVKKCGVFAGVEPGDYLHLLMSSSEQSENSPVFQGNTESILAARISYFLDLKGPSIAINTACSSSLVAIHLACQSLINGECDLALAGGVRVFSSGKAYLALGNMGMLSPEGQCKTFDEAANGFVPGEAVGVLVLKPLSAALLDGDHLYGVIKGSAINQDGRTNGITAPSSLSQTAVELEVYDKFGLSPETFQFVEAHGTGTKLGDPIEIDALTQSFRRFTTSKSFCAVGSVKTNIGHTMAAAGVCSIIKVLLALQNRSIPPSLNLQRTNPYIDFENSPFYVNTALREWKAGVNQPRRAAVSSFGFSGTNSHMVIEQAPETDRNLAGALKPAYLVTLSAKTAEALQQRLDGLIGWLQVHGERAELEEISFTLNTGRSHFEHRCAIVAGSIAELGETLGCLASGTKTEKGWRSEQRKSDARDDVIFRQVIGAVLKEMPEALRQGELAYRDKLNALAALYTRNVDFDFAVLHQGEAHRRISLPTYPFARERYWVPGGPQEAVQPWGIDTEDHKEGAEAADPQREGISTFRLHPLVHRNVSTLTQTKFESSFDGTEFFFQDHQIRGERILPGAAYLEMAAAAIRLAMEGAPFGLANIAWMRPLTANSARKVTIRLFPDEEDVRFQILSGDADILHAQGKSVRNLVPGVRREDLGAIRARCTKTESPDNLLQRCAEAGLTLGDSFQTIRQVWYGENEALAQLELGSTHAAAAEEFTLHPGLVDGALQTTALFGRGQGGGLPVPFAVREILFRKVGSNCYAHVRPGSEENGTSTGLGTGLLRFDINLLDESGDVLAELKGFAMRALRPAGTGSENEVVFVRSNWEKKTLSLADPERLAGRLLLLDSEEWLANELGARWPGLEVWRVIPAQDYRVQEKIVGIRPDCPEDYDQLVGLVPPDFVVDRWYASANGKLGTIERAVLPLFELTRALIRQKWNAPTKLLLAYPPGADALYPAVAGFARTLRQERPNLRLKVLESAPSEILALTAELLDLGDDQEIRIREGQREVKRLEMFAPQRTTASPFRQRGVYVIAGGLGGLGRIFAHYLVRRYRARVVLLGRTPETDCRSVLAELEMAGAKPLYLQTDVSRREEVIASMHQARTRFGEINGVIHAAGVIRDGFLLHKTAGDFAAVLAPKILGATFLDQATCTDPLDFFVLFSSMAGVLGNVGQSDYAYANCYLDEFAGVRERQVSLGERSGRTISLNWPLWRNGGMRQAADFERLKLIEMGLALLEDEVGLGIFETALQCGEQQLMPLFGQAAKIRSLVTPADPRSDLQGNEQVSSRAASEAGFRPRPKPASGPEAGPGNQSAFADLSDSALAYLTGELAKLVKLPAARIRPDDPLEKFGIDSIMVMEFTQQLEKDFGELSKTLLFEHQTLGELANYFLINHRHRFHQMLDAPDPKTATQSEFGSRSATRSPDPEAVPILQDIPMARPDSREHGEGEIAIIGLFGRYPMADNLEQFWENLRTGRDCIVEIPKERWDYRLFYDPAPGVPGKTPNKWGGFLTDIERFDAQFFNITPREAFALDPQERLFLETVWRTVEDAGYRKSELANRKVGVFVGVMYGEYQLYGAGDIAEGKVFPLSSSYASIANRVSYVFNWHGPSMAVDTMCSSSLTAIHLACESLRRGESELAIAGGVNATLHPHKDMLLSPGGFAASDGRCRSFGKGGDGYVPGEGVGAVLLKPLVKAVADGDHVYGVVRASTVNHGGKTNGYTVPNPNAQAELILAAFEQGNVAPRTVNYIEAHGTGTALGDPIEIAGLSRAFAEDQALGLHSCAVGSVKSNVGHLESAAGIAGVTKILLQMQHGQIAPSLHSEKLNPNINFANSVFHVPQTLQAWQAAATVGGISLRRAGVSSFGAGGANAHLILEEFVGDQADATGDLESKGPFLIILSAKTEDRLRARAEQLLEYFQGPAVNLVSLKEVAYTLQIGREPLDERLAFEAKDVGEAIRKSRQFLDGEADEGIYRANSRAGRGEAGHLLDGEEGRAFVDALIRQRKWQKLARYWVTGGQVEWAPLYQGQRVRRISLPTYPFAGESYWAPDKLPVTSKKSSQEGWLHSLIHRNVSDFEGQKFLTRLDPDDLATSLGADKKFLPGLWLLEMGLAAARLSSKEPFHQVADVEWAAPQLVAKGLTLLTEVFASGKTARFQIRPEGLESPILVHGSLLRGSPSAPEKESLDDVRGRCVRAGQLDGLHQRLAGVAGQFSGSTWEFQEIWRGSSELLIRYQRGGLETSRFAGCDLHPGLLQAIMEAVLILEGAVSGTQLGPLSLESALVQKMPVEGWCHVTLSEGKPPKRTIRVRVLDLDGFITAALGGLEASHFQIPELPGAFFLRPVWKESQAPVLDSGLLSGRLLLFDQDALLERDIRARHPSFSVTRVTSGQRFIEEKGLFQIDPQAEEDYARLIDSVNPDFILHRWAGGSLPDDGMSSGSRHSGVKTSSLAGIHLESALEIGIFSLFRLTRTLVKRNLNSEIRLLFCHPSMNEPAFSAVSAFAKTVGQEQPKLHLRVLGTEEGTAGLLAEFCSPRHEYEVRFQEGGRQIRGFEPVEPKKETAIPLRQRGVYLITGGLGGLGCLFANYLAEQYQARLVLTGRSMLTDEARTKIAEMEAKGGEVLYVRADVALIEGAHQVVSLARQRFGLLNGLIHAAGLLRDSFLLKKDFKDFVEVLRPKVHGVVALDEATRGESLDFFALFSSTAGAFGNVGQADYAYANGFLDAFAYDREARRSIGQRQGKTISINWPLWKDGGMSMPGQSVEAHLERMGLRALSRIEGISLFETALSQEESQLVALWGARSKLTQIFVEVYENELGEPGTTVDPVDEPALVAKLEAYLKETLAAVTQLPVTQIDSEQRFEEFGVDSIVVSDFNLCLEKSLGALPKTLLFEHANFRQLSRHLVSAFKPQVARFLGGAAVQGISPRNGVVQSPWPVLKAVQPINHPDREPSSIEDIAIIGLAGRYPKADDLRAFWDILKSGTDCVTEIPKSRWDIDQYYDPDPNKAAEGKIYSRWGAFLDDVDKFDPLFFNIAPVEAELMDPQERLFLETAWSTLEDAGYTRRDLARWVRKEYAANVGVFVGVTTNTYSLVARDNGGRRAMPTTLPWSLANRVSYLFNFNGPSIPVDTACSSSLTAIHLACDAIRHGNCQQAIAGGVNLYLHPSKYVSLCVTRMLSTDGKCRAFGAGGDGFVPGEGVGAVLLKPLSMALADGDQVYGVIKGTAVNHGGRTNGYTVPNPAAQADLIIQALKQSGIDPATLTYLETHGTGTALGDPIEVAGLVKAFGAAAHITVPGVVCSLGSVKTNIGHLEAAAGIAGLTKILLQMKHRQLVPSLHADQINSNIAFEGTPFQLQRILEEWQPLGFGHSPRRGGVSSFGAGGSNAFVVVEEFLSKPVPTNGKPLSDSLVLIVLSARRPDRLKKLAESLAEFLEESSEVEAPLPSVAYTLQVGREALEERIAFVVGNRVDLISKLQQIGHGNWEDMRRGRVKRGRVQIASEVETIADNPMAVEALVSRDLELLGRLWVDGITINWGDLIAPDDAVRRISLPGYPFSRERYWVPVPDISEEAENPIGLPWRPSLPTNESTLESQRYESSFTGLEVVLRDHQVGGQKVLPGAASLELALAGASKALGNSKVRLQQVVWLRPLKAGTDGLKIALVLRSDGKGRLDFQLKEMNGEVHVQGKAEISENFVAEAVELDAIRARCPETISPEELYPAFAARGLEYGAGFRVIQEIRYSSREMLSIIEVPREWGGEKYRLHPALVDGALQSLAVISSGAEGMELPFAVNRVECGQALPSRCYAYGRVESERDSLRRYELKLLDEHGKVLARFSGLSVRRFEKSQGELFFCRPVWNPEPLEVRSRIVGPVLLFDEDTELALALEKQGRPTVRVVPGETYRRVGNVITIRREKTEDYERLSEEVFFDAVIHRWAGRGSPLGEALGHGLFSVNRLGQALLKMEKAVPWLYCYPANEAAYEAVSGYAKSLLQEHPKLQLRTVGYDGSVAILIDELNAADLEVRYTGGRRQVRALEEFPMPASEGASLFRNNGVYLLTGGTGGLGLIFAEYLVEMYEARVVLVGRSELNKAKELELRKLGDQVSYLRADISRLEEARAVVRDAKERHGGLNGVIHAAGYLRDGLIRRKTDKDFEAVLAGKVWGAEALDAATSSESLDLFILFSSTAGLLGNAGQSDYAFANAYLDSFAFRREELRRAGKRSGRTFSLDWPLWRKGGMQAGEAAVHFQAQQFGLRPLETEEGLIAFEKAICSGEVQCAVFCGVPQKLLAHLNKKPTNLQDDRRPRTIIEAEGFKKRLFSDVKGLVAKVLRLDAEVIEPQADTSEYGFDSITFTALANELNTLFDFEITPAVLFEYRTLEMFVDFLCQEQGEKLAARYADQRDLSAVSNRADEDSLDSGNGELAFAKNAELAISKPASISGNPVYRSSSRANGEKVNISSDAEKATGTESVAIIGMSGVFPGSPDLEAFWRNLEEGKDLICRATDERWNFLSGPRKPGAKTESKERPWGGFIADPDKFDPLFFDISPREAELMDPQQRLFLQVVWHTLEDAGYKKSDFAGTKTGLFAGVAANDYANLLATHGVPVEAYSSTGNAHSVLANRVSYFFDLRGPSEAIDTACSSSLVAIHRAIESLASGSSEMAIVGGVNVLLSPGAFLAFGKAGMLCEDGRCKTFDARANGYVRGEGVGAILLKSLSRARQDGDHIYAVILGTAENHGGRVQSLTVPNPNAQAELLRDAYKRAGVDPFTISYIEAHGTGTSLGDPIEINGLKKAFGQNIGEVPEPRCAVGSVKTNIGHLETAAGIAGIIKTLLAIRHRRIPGNVHLKQINPYIKLEGTPFVFPMRSEPWELLRDCENRTIPRRAGISSFGFGGTNAHVLLEEYPEAIVRSEEPDRLDGPQLFVFSARDRSRLEELVSNFLAYLNLRTWEHEELLPDLGSIVYTLQVGREPMDERLAVIASAVTDLSGQLTKFLQGQRSNLFCGNVADNKASLQLLRQLHEDDSFLEPLIKERQLAKLAHLWVSGVQVNWDQLWTGRPIRRASLPGYPFARRRYWVPAIATQNDELGEAEVRLHPLLHRNDSTLKVQRYESKLGIEEIVLRDHRVSGQPMLPGAASLELALAGACRALENSSVRLRQVLWMRPVTAGEEGVVLQLELRPENGERVNFQLRNPAGEVYVRGKAEIVARSLEEAMDLEGIRERCQQKVPAAKLYSGFSANGLEYGSGFQSIVEMSRGEGEVFSELKVPLEWGKARYRLHPALIDGALQSLAMVGADRSERLELPFAVDEVECADDLPSRCYAYGRIESDLAGVRRYETMLLGEHGEILARLRGFATRRFEFSAKEFLYYRPLWKPDPLPNGRATRFAGTVLLFDESPEIEGSLALSGFSTIRVIPGEVYQQSERVVKIRRDSAQDYERLVREINFAAVIYRWSRPVDSLDEALEQGLYSLHRLVQALLKSGKTLPLIYVYPAGEVACQAIGGYVKTLRQEQPNFRLKTLGITDAVPNLLEELTDDSLEVCYRDAREVRTLEELPSSLAATGLTLRQGGVYLVSGGAGGLGRIFAEYLVQKYDARLVLVGRSELDQSKRQELALLGDQVIYVRADISTKSGAESVVRQARQQYGSLHGVFHAAGELRDGLIWRKGLEDMKAVLAAKVKGVEALDAATSQEPLDCFVLFSSIAGLFGNAGQSDYAYANAYLDAFAHRREEMRRTGKRFGQTLSLNWPLWRNGGMKGKETGGNGDLLGLVPLDQDAGLRIFETALSSGQTQVWGAVGNRDKIRALLLERPSESWKTTPPAPPLRGLEKSATHNTEVELTNYLIEQVAALSKIEVRQIEPVESLEKYGLDSIMAVEFSQHLERDFGELSKALLFEYPTIEALAGYFLNNHSERLGSLWPRNPQETLSVEPLRAHEVIHSSVANGTNGGSNGHQEMESFAVGKKRPRTLALAPLDYLFVGPRRFAIQVLYHFESHLDFARLQSGLRNVAEAFYPINSQLVRRQEEYFIHESADEPDFAEIICDERVVLPEQDRPESFAHFQVPFNPLLSGEKLAKFRLFQLSGGSLLSVSVSHAIADGYSFYYFLSSWAAACRGEFFQAPDHSQDFLNRLLQRSSTTPWKTDSNSAEQFNASFPFLEAGAAPTTNRVEALGFDAASLLAEARQGADELMRSKITENSVLTALVWQEYARALPPETEELVLACPIDFRRLISELSPFFFGNASAPALLRLDRRQVLAESIPCLAAMISDAVRRCDELTLVRYNAAIDDLRRREGIDGTERVELVDPRNGLIVTNVARFQLPPIDFGAGSFNQEFTPINYAGTAVIVSGEGSAVKVRLSFPET